MRRQELKSTRKKSLYTDQEDKNKINVLFFTTVDPSTTNEGRVYSYICGSFPATSRNGNKYIYLMYVYDCTDILKIEMKNISYKK